MQSVTNSFEGLVYVSKILCEKSKTIWLAYFEDQFQEEADVQRPEATSSPRSLINYINTRETTRRFDSTEHALNRVGRDKVAS